MLLKTRRMEAAQTRRRILNENSIRRRKAWMTPSERQFVGITQTFIGKCKGGSMTKMGAGSASACAASTAVFKI